MRRSGDGQVALALGATLAMALAASGQQVELRALWRTGLTVKSSRIVVADVDGDGDDEAVFCGDGSVVVLPADPDGGFLPAWHGQDCRRCSAVAVGDRDGDGLAEVYYASSWGAGGSSVTAQLYVFSPTRLATLARMPVPEPAADLAVFDVDADGRQEIVVVGSTSTTVYDALTLQREWLARGKGGRQVAVADLDGDALPEIVVNGDRLTHVLDAVNRRAEFALNGGYGPSIKLGDVTGDGRVDIAFTEYLEDAVGVLDPLTLTRLWTDSRRYGFHSVALADLDGDGDDEVVAGTGRWGDDYPGEIRAYSGTDGARLWTLQGYGRSIAAADVDGDGVVEGLWASDWAFAVGDPETGSVDQWSRRGSEPPMQARAGDIDGDGTVEMVVVRTYAWWSSTVEAFDLVDGRQRWSVDLDEAVSGIAIGQVDGDPRIEVAVVCQAGSGASVLVIDGATGAVEWQGEPMGRFDRLALEIAQLDGDPVEELIVSLGYHRVLVLDGVGPLLEWEHVSDEWVRDLALGNVDSDPATELGLLTSAGVRVVDTADWSDQAQFEVLHGQRLVFQRDRVVVGTYQDSYPSGLAEIEAFTPSGELLWSRELAGERLWALAAARRLDQELVIVSTTWPEPPTKGGSVLAVMDASDGEVLAREVRPAKVHQLWAIDGDGDGVDEVVAVSDYLVELDSVESAAGTAVSLSAETAGPDTEVTLELELATGGVAVSSLVVDVLLRPPLSLVAVRPGSATTHMSVTSGEIVDGVRVSIGGDESVIGDGVIARIDLAVAADARTGSHVVEVRPVSLLDNTGHARHVAGVTGTVEVSGGEPPEGCGWTKWYVAAAAHIPGEGGSLWRTDLSVHNPGSSAERLRLWFYPRDKDNTTAPCVDAGMVPADASVWLPDVVRTVFGVDGAGGIGVGNGRTNTGYLQVSSRTYNQTESGTFGQSIQAQRGAGVAEGETAILTQLHENPSYRTNLGFLVAGTKGALVEVRLLDAQGVLHRQEIVMLKGFEARQLNRAFGAGAGVTNGLAEVSVLWGSKVYPYASVVDNETGDPTYVSP